MMNAERSTMPPQVTPFKADSLPEPELPPSNTRRWVASRKAAVVNAVREGRITLEEVCRRYELSEEEFAAWKRLIEQHGIEGLRTTRTQEFRTPISPASREPPLAR